MNTLKKAKELVASMSPGEKAELLQWVARDLGAAFPGIDRTPGISGGDPVIVRTRIPVWLLVQAKKSGASDADILKAYPNLRAEDLANAWNYFQAHHQEIESQILENELA